MWTSLAAASRLLSSTAPLAACVSGLVSVMDRVRGDAEHRIAAISDDHDSER
jgi:hypothetical protein